MAKLKFEQRFSVGNEHKRSTIWKVTIRGSDIYLTSRLTHQDTKLSLHESGECNYSFTSEYIRNGNHLNIVNRHIAQWYINPQGQAAEIAFEIFIPVTELLFHEPEKKLNKVHWIDTPEDGKQIQIVGYITPKIALNKDVLPPKELGEVLIYKRLSNLKFFVLSYKEVPIQRKNLEIISEFKKSIIKEYSIHKNGWHGLLKASKEKPNVFIEYHIMP